MIALSLLLLAIGAILIHAALSGKSIPDVLKSGLPFGTSTPSFGAKSVGVASDDE